MTQSGTAQDPQLVDGAVRRLSEMAALVHQGLPPEEAALRVRVSGTPDVSPEPVARLGDTGALGRVAAGFDVEGLTRVLDEGFALGEYEDVVDGWLLPSLGGLGEAWSQGRINVAEEHFASASVHRRLATIFDETPRPLRGPRVLVGLAPGSRHELGVLAFAIALRRQGVDAVYLGGDVPTQAWVTAAVQRHPEAVVIAVPSKEDVLASRELVTSLALAAPKLPVLVGGSHQHRIADGVTHLGHRITPAAERLAAAVKAKI